MPWEDVVAFVTKKSWPPSVVTRMLAFSQDRQACGKSGNRLSTSAHSIAGLRKWPKETMKDGTEQVKKTYIRWVVWCLNTRFLVRYQVGSKRGCVGLH